MQKFLEALLKKALVNRLCRLFTVSVFLLLFASGSVSLYAQQTGSLTGTILDPKGGVLQKATVTVKSESTSDTRKATADAQGHFSITGLPIAKYTVEASAPGFSTTIRRSVQLIADQTQDLTLSLNVGNVSQQVSVDAEETKSLAARVAPLDALLSETSPRSEINLDLHSELLLARRRLRRAHPDGPRLLHHQLQRSRPRPEHHQLPWLP